ncbi:MAG: phage Gp37/Gp68 family protein [Gammaproteobacteria bacterium]|nr:phage Gp37/Gp68 family protein [Gammaproteobacteria bacterium]
MSRIEWTEATWTIISGCSKIGRGCKFCYSEREWARLSANPATLYYGRAFGDVRFHPVKLREPWRWRRPRRVFVSSMGDLFHPSVRDEDITAVFAVMAACRHHTFQVLTKRASRMQAWLSELTAMSSPVEVLAATLETVGLGDLVPALKDAEWPLPNLLAGVSVDDQDSADARIPLLLNTPATRRFVSVEPLLAPLSLSRVQASNHVVLDALCGCGVDQRALTQAIPNIHCNRLDWVIVGGESGPHARPLHPDWVRRLREECAASEVPFLFKQWGEWGPVESVAPHDGRDAMRLARMDDDTVMYRIGRAKAGRVLDGCLHDAMPAELVGTHPRGER